VHHGSTQFLNAHRMRRLAAVLLPSLLWFGCGGPAPLTVDMPLHLEEHLDAATITGSELPPDPPQTVEWRFDQPQPDWKATPQWPPTVDAATLARTGEALRVTLTDLNRTSNGRLIMVGGIHVDLPDWDRGDWADVVIRARADSASSVSFVHLLFNLREGRPTTTHYHAPFQFGGQNSPIVRDGSIQTYRLRADWSSNTWTGTGVRPRPEDMRRWQGPWRQLGLWFGAANGEPGSIEILSVSVVPKGALYADSPHGVRPVTIGERIRRTLFTHAPGSMAYRVSVPQQGRLNVGLGALTVKAPVTFAITARQGDGEVDTLFEEQYADPEQWGQRSVDLSNFAGQTVTLALEAQAEQPGTVALWGAPTVSGARSADKPNVIFYVIDGGGADQMSLYGYNRRTTPNLERLAAEGAIFEYSYSNSSSTRPSTASFMTSLHNSVLGAPDRFEPLPAEARTMAERFHEAGYQTAVFTSNPWAGAVSSLERGVDVFRDEGVDQPNSRSSVELHRDFWDWRDAFPGEPYWVHVQTTDVHAPNRPTAPFAGLFAPEVYTQLAQWAEWGGGPDDYNLWRALFDETMAHQDYQLGRFVARLRETGQWEQTLLIIAADHSIQAGSDDFLTALVSPLPFGSRPPSPILSSSTSRVPLLFVWPGKIAGGQRFHHPVSMIDVLPTVLELAGLPPPQTLQGQSLAPLLLGRAGWQPRPVIFDEFEKDPRTRELRGSIEMIDGRWGASLRIGPPPEDPTEPRLLLFDVWNDPLALTLMNDAHPDLVTKYTALLEKQWEAHRLLATRFTPGEKVEVTPAQLEALRALGYIR